MQTSSSKFISTEVSFGNQRLLFAISIRKVSSVDPELSFTLALTVFYNLINKIAYHARFRCDQRQVSYSKQKRAIDIQSIQKVSLLEKSSGNNVWNIEWSLLQVGKVMCSASTKKFTPFRSFLQFGFESRTGAGIEYPQHGPHSKDLAHSLLES